MQFCQGKLPRTDEADIRFLEEKKQDMSPISLMARTET